MKHIVDYIVDLSKTEDIIDMPHGAIVLNTGSGGRIFVLADTSRYLEPRTFYVVRTGSEAPMPASYIGTCEGGFTIHIFEKA